MLSATLHSRAGGQLLGKPLQGLLVLFVALLVVQCRPAVADAAATGSSTVDAQTGGFVFVSTDDADDNGEAAR